MQFMERLNLDAAELDPRLLPSGEGSLFAESDAQDGSDMNKTGVVGSMLSKVGSSASKDWWGSVLLMLLNALCKPSE